MRPKKTKKIDYWGMLYVTVLKSYISYIGKFSRYMNSYVSGPTTYSHYLPTTPIVRNLTDWGSQTHPNWSGQPNAP
jgi:hypothetical protein